MRDLGEEVRGLFEEAERVEARTSRASTKLYCGHYRAGRWGPWKIERLPGVMSCRGCGRELQTLQSLSLHKCQKQRTAHPHVVRRKRAGLKACG